MAVDRHRVMAASAAWVWVPDGAVEVRHEAYRLIRYPERFWGPGFPSALVAWFDDAMVTEPLVNEVANQAAAWGIDGVSWWTSDATPTAERTLRDRGAEVVETVRVLARELDDGDGLVAARAPSHVTVAVVDDAASLRGNARVRAAGWRQPFPDEAQLAADLRRTLTMLDRGSEFQVVATIDGQPVATGGCEIADGVARLWGAVTLAEHRHRGAYRAVLGERLRLAARYGADLALVKGRVKSSAPILVRAGFGDHGEERRHRVASGAGSR